MTEGGPGVIFSDISLEAIAHLKERKIAHHGLVMSVTDIPFASKSIPAIVCSEVIEHVREDEKALREMHRVLEPGGAIILTVPMHPRYYAFDDYYVQHIRRYKLWPFLRKLRKIGFKNLQIVKVTGFLDKMAMVALTRVYSLFLRPKQKNPNKNGAIFLKAILPIYKTLNRIYAFAVEWEARLMPLSTSAVVLIHGVKAGNLRPVLRVKAPEEKIPTKAG